MFEITTPTTAELKTITPRTEHHGDAEVVAITMKLQITGPNTILDSLSPKLRPAVYAAVEGQEQLPGVEPSTPILRCGDVEAYKLRASFEGWTLKVDHGIDDDPIAIGGCKVDKFELDAMSGGAVKLSFRVGSNDVSSEEIGILCGKLGSEISITLHAPEKPADAIDGTTAAFEKDHPEAGDIFAQQHGDGEVGDGNTDDGPPNETEASPPVVEDPSIADLSRARTARGRERMKRALAEGA